MSMVADNEVVYGADAFDKYMENNNYTTKILIDDNKDSYKSNLKTVATSSHPIIDYAFYMINDDLKRRERLKNSLTLIKGGKK